MRNIKLVLEYDGTNYHGWQTQPNLPTIPRHNRRDLGETNQNPDTNHRGREDRYGCPRGGTGRQLSHGFTNTHRRISERTQRYFASGYRRLLRNGGVRRVPRPFQCDKPTVPVYDFESGISECTFATDKLFLSDRN